MAHGAPCPFRYLLNVEQLYPELMGNIIRVSESRRMGLAGHAARMGAEEIFGRKT